MSFTHFLTQTGKASLVDKGPWHYGADYIAVYFKADRNRLRELLPRPLELTGDTAVAYVSEFVSLSEKNPDAFYVNPAQTVYREAAVGVACSYKGRAGIYFCFMWVDRDWSMIRGWLNGYPKKLADEIIMSKPHPLNPLAGSLGIGLRLSGYCARHGQRILNVSVKLTRKGLEDDVIKFGPTYGWRHFPTTDDTQTAVKELVEVLKYNMRVSDVWVGVGEVGFGNAVNEELELIHPIETLYGLYYRAGFTIRGAKVLERLP